MALIDKDQAKSEIKRIMSRAMDEKGQDICEYVLAFLDTLKETPTWVNRAEQRQKDQADGKKIAIMEIRAEIERRTYNAHEMPDSRPDKQFYEGKDVAYSEILAFLDTLPEQEHPIYELNQILLDWVREAKTDKEHEARFEAHKRFFELYDEYMEQEPEQPVEGLEEEIQDWCKENVTGVNPIYTANSLICGLLPKTARHFAEWGAENLKR